VDASRVEKKQFDDSHWDVIAHTTGELGVGEIARRLISLLTASGVDTNIVPFEASRSRKTQDFILKTGSRRNGANLISCVNPDQLATLIALYDISPTDPNKHVGFWAWELEDFPRKFNSAANLLDEIWTISHHSMEAINKTSPTNARHVQVPVPIPSSKSQLTRSHFELPDNKFMVLTSFDYFSDVHRKNPMSTIEAFIKAFPRPEAALLVVKSINGERYAERSNSLRELAAGRSDIVFIDSYFNQYENLSLIELSDVFISLHRAEGYGLNLADAMARKVTTIATAYSGNLGFMDGRSSVLVPYELVPVKEYAGLKFNSVWAHPDVAYAASELRKLYEEPSRLSSLGRKGFDKIAREHSLKAARERFQKEFMHA
jgi:glycosyltransferase involved in cell wall biosynthesis